MILDPLLQVSAGQAGYWMAFPMSSPPLVDAIYSPKGRDGDLSMSIDDAPVKVFCFATQIIVANFFRFLSFVQQINFFLFLTF